MAGRRKPGTVAAELSKADRAEVAAAVHETEVATGLQVAVYVGPSEDDPGAHAERLLVEAGAMSSPAVLVLVAPAVRRVELRTAPAARARFPDEAAERAVAAMTEGFAAGHLVEGVRAGLRIIAEVAGPPPAGEAAAEELPDVFGP